MYKLPHVPKARELIDNAFRAGAKEAKMIGMKNDSKRLTGEIKRVETASSIICGDLSAIVKYFPSYDQMSEFEKCLMEIRVKKDSYKKSLATVDWCNDRVLSLRNKTLRKLKTQKDPTESRVFLARAASFVKRISKDLDYLSIVKGVIRELPVLRDAPTLVVAGIPNAGKSTFCRTLTGSKIKIAPYPFTTVGIMVGYKRVRYTDYQIIDSPGILDRPMSERNKVELQAIAALKYLADVVLFIIDHQQDIEPQRKLLEEIKGSFESNIVTVVNDKGGATSKEYTIFNAKDESECIRIFNKCFSLGKEDS